MAQSKTTQHRRGRTGKLVCRCGKGYGSEFDGLCMYCRGCTGWQAAERAKLASLSPAGRAFAEHDKGPRRG